MKKNVKHNFYANFSVKTGQKNKQKRRINQKTLTNNNKANIVLKENENESHWHCAAH